MLTRTLLSLALFGALAATSALAGAGPGKAAMPVGG